VKLSIKERVTYKTDFTITSASEMMAILCLAKNRDDLKDRIEQMIVAYTKDGLPIYVRNLNIIDAIMHILEDAFKVNVVQTSNNNLAIIHGGPFANIAHGTNSLLSIKTAMNLADYTIVESGFGSDLGLEKFYDIVARESEITPAINVIVVSLRSLKLHGGVREDKINEVNHQALRKGLANLKQHLINTRAFNVPTIVAINRFEADNVIEIRILMEFLRNQKVRYAVCTPFTQGAEGCRQLAQMVVDITTNNAPTPEINYAYKLEDPIEKKIHKIVTRCYGASGVNFSKEAKQKLSQLSNKKYYICMAKTPLNFTDNPDNLTPTKEFKITVDDIVLANGARFIIPICRKIYLMPGLPIDPIAQNAKKQ